MHFSVRFSLLHMASSSPKDDVCFVVRKITKSTLMKVASSFFAPESVNTLEDNYWVARDAPCHPIVMDDR